MPELGTWYTGVLLGSSLVETCYLGPKYGRGGRHHPQVSLEPVQKMWAISSPVLVPVPGKPVHQHCQGYPAVSMLLQREPEEVSCAPILVAGTSGTVLLPWPPLRSVEIEVLPQVWNSSLPLCFFSKVEIPVLEELTAYQLMGVPPGCQAGWEWQSKQYWPLSHGL